MKKILFVCLGNICRSSSAEGVMKHLIEEAGRADEFLIDSAGILSYHQGELPDSRMRAHAAPRLACVKPVASVHPEPGSNSSL